MTDNVEQFDNVTDSNTDNSNQLNTTNNTVLNTANNTSIDTSIPDKFKVTAEDGSINYQATVAKMNESYSYLEKKVGTGDIAPASADEYKSEREGFSFDEFKQDESNTAFLKAAHAHGITNKQMDFLLSEYESRAVDLVSASSQLDTDTTVQTLQSEWGSNFESNIFNAIKAAKSAGLTEDDLNNPLVGNNLSVIKAFAYFGSQLSEDKATNLGAPVTADVQSLMRSEAFFDQKHPEHKAVKAQIDAYYNSLRK